jgi:hypothetical protein
MRDIKGNSLADRQQNANKAKQALLEKMRAAPRPDDPEVVAQRAAKSALLAANKAERERRRAEKAAAIQAEAERAAAAEAAEREAAERKKREEADKIVTLLAEQKAARDARYAARKTRKA